MPDLFPDVTPAEIAALSNSISGHPEAVRSLERRGLVTDVREEVRDGRPVAFFELTPEAESLHREHFVHGGD